MRYFVCLLDTEGAGISDEVRLRYEWLPRKRGLESRWQHAPGAAILTAWDNAWGDPLVARDGAWVAMGAARLDNRRDLERWTGGETRGLTDLELVLRVVAKHGVRYIPQFLGDFGFVVWNSQDRTVTAASDAFGLKGLYVAKRDRLLALASRAEALAVGERYELEYLARLVGLSGPPPHLTVYAGVHPVPAASMATLRLGELALNRYWDPLNFERAPTLNMPASEIVQSCLRLLIESIRPHLGSPEETWAQLSGGLDSSSVVSLVQWLAARGEITRGLAGTVTFVDRQGSGTDERQYSEAVVHRWGVRNETIIDPPTWHDDRYPPHYTDQPSFDFHVYPRDRRLCALVHDAGGRVLLTGCGGDELFGGTMLFFADWIAEGHVWRAISEMARRAALGRVSFWELAFKNALLPLLPQAVQHRLAHDMDEPSAQPWLEARTLRKYQVSLLSAAIPEYGGPWRHKYRHAIVAKAATLASVTHQGMLADELDVRHPLLHRPLVEFAMRLPQEMRARPHAHRWVLREALRGILPSAVRTRIGKSETADVLALSLAGQRTRLRSLLKSPILAELGLVNAAKLRTAFEATSRSNTRREWMHAPVMSTLAVEAWLQMRSGRWPRGGHPCSTEESRQIQLPSP